CDVIEDRARAAGEKNGVAWFTYYGEMLAKSDSDIVVVATPSGLHPEHGVKAAEAGKHVVTEKPMAISLSGADRLVASCEKAGVQLFVVKQNRLNAPVQLVRRAIEKGRFGKIYLANPTVPSGR